jgi:hypothetical protein
MSDFEEIEDMKVQVDNTLEACNNMGWEETFSTLTTLTRTMQTEFEESVNLYDTANRMLSTSVPHGLETPQPTIEQVLVARNDDVDQTTDIFTMESITEVLNGDVRRLAVTRNALYSEYLQSMGNWMQTVDQLSGEAVHIGRILRAEPVRNRAQDVDTLENLASEETGCIGSDSEEEDCETGLGVVEAAHDHGWDCQQD